MTRTAFAQHVSRLRTLQRLQLARYASCGEQYKAYLEAGCEELDLSLGMISRVREDEYEVLAGVSADSAVQLGKRFNPEDSWCGHVVEYGHTIAFHQLDASQVRSGYPLRINAEQESYIGTPIRVRDRIVGTLDFSDSAPRTAAFADEEIEFIEFMAATLGRSLERDLLEDPHHSTVERMEESSALFEGAFIHAPIGMALVGTDGRWLRVNDAICDIVGYSAHELLHIDFQTITHPDDLNTDLELLQETLDGKRDSYQMEKRYIHRDGSIVWILLSVSLVRDRKGLPRFFIAQIQDITAQVNAEHALKVRQGQLEALNQQLDELAHTDSLTGLANRREFMNRLNQEIQRSNRNGCALSVILMDVDHFKKYNDTFGHPEGDEVLKILAENLRHNARDTDLVARHGGEEFAVLLPETRAEEAVQMAERIRGWMRDVDSLHQPVSISLGVNEFRPGNTGASTEVDSQIRQLLTSADAALYDAKRAGRNRVCEPHNRDTAAAALAPNAPAPDSGSANR